MLLLAVYGLNIGYTQAQNGRFPLMPGATLVPGTKYFSESGKHYVVFSAGSDGNLCIWSADGNFLWGSVQYGIPSGGNRAVFQADGNFVINKNSDVVWASNSKDGKKMTLNGEGQLLITDASNKTLWKANPGSAVTLFADGNFGGSYLQLDRDEINDGEFKTIKAGFIDFDNKTSSIRVAKGYKAELYMDKSFQNPRNCLILFEGDYKIIGRWDDAISAVKVSAVLEGTPIVKFFDDWWGGLQQNLGPGTYNASNLLADDAYTTMSISEGAIVDVFAGPDCTGAKNADPIKKTKGNTEAFEDIDLKGDYNMNDMISGIVIKRVNYMLDNIKITAERTISQATSEKSGGKVTVTNNTEEMMTTTKTVEVTTREESSISWQNATMLGLSITSTVGVEAKVAPGISASASLSIAASVENTFTFGGVKTKGKEVKNSDAPTINIPAGRTYELYLTVEEVVMEYDVVYIYVPFDSIDGRAVKQPNGRPYEVKGVVTVKNAQNAHVVGQVVGGSGTSTGTGTSAPADISNRALNLEGSSNYITLGNIGNVNDWTIELWFKTNSPVNYENLFHSKDLGTNEGVRLEMSSVGSRGKLYVSVAGSNSFLPETIVAYTEDLSADWHHLAIVGNKSQNKLLVYLDGVKKVDQAHTNWPASFPNFVLGRGFSADGNRNYNGSMDEVRIWSFARNAGDIQTTKGNLTGNEANLLAHYNFNQGIPGGNNTSMPTLLANKKGPNGTMTGFKLTGSTSNFIKP